jgi:hypothetical protein
MLLVGGGWLLVAAFPSAGNLFVVGSPDALNAV